MTLTPFQGFQFLHTHHCVTGSLRHIYVFNGHPLSEEMLLGIGEGVGFSYWHFKGQLPFLGGRGNVGVGQQEGLEKTTCRRTGVAVQVLRTASAKKAEQTMLEMLEKGQPVMLQVDMGYLPYFDFGGSDYHFGGHVVVACGYDAAAGMVLIADRDGGYPVSLADVAKARGSKHKPFAPEHQWYVFDFSAKRQPIANEVRQAIATQARGMLEPVITNLGVAGIRKAAQRIPKWPRGMTEDELRWALFNSYIFISPQGGSGGGNFRYMLSRFLDEAAVLANEPCLAKSAAEFKSIADGWAALGEWFRLVSEDPQRLGRLDECAAPLRLLAEQEEAGWQRLSEILV